MRRLAIEKLENRELLSTTTPSLDAGSFSANVFDVVGKAQPDEWYNGFGQPYVAYGDQQPGDPGKPKVNHDYIWGMTTVGDDIWFGTSGNAAMTAQMASGPKTVETALSVGEGKYSQYPGVPDGLKSLLGDWRPPTMHHYNSRTGAVEDVTPNDPLVNWTLGIRSAGSNSQVVILAGPDLTMTGTSFFAFSAQTGRYLGSKHMFQYGDIRRWLTVGDQLYTATMRTYSTTGEGVVLRWQGDVQHPFRFEEVGDLDLEGAYIVEHQGRLYVSTWPLWNGSLMGQLGYRSEAKMGIWMSPRLGTSGLTSRDASRWQKVWSVDQYETDPVISDSIGGGALASFDGYLYWGTIQVQNTGKSIFLEHYPNENPPDLLQKTTRPTALFRAKDFNGSPVELLYGDNELAHYTPAGSDPTTQPAVWEMVPNGTGPAKWGPAGFGNAGNIYSWSMQVSGGNLYVGTLDMSYTYLSKSYIQAGGDSDVMEQMIAQLGAPGVRVGADVWCIPPDDGQPYPITLEGAGNPLNNGVRNMVSTSQGLFLGSANGSNLMTTPYDPPTQPLKEGGWELIHVVPVVGQDLGTVNDDVVLTNQNVAARDLWYRLTTTAPGSLTVEAAPALPGRDIEATLYTNSVEGPVPGVSWIVPAGQQITWESAAGKTYYLQLHGNALAGTVAIIVPSVAHTPPENSTTPEQSPALADAAISNLYEEEPPLELADSQLLPEELALLA